MSMFANLNKSFINKFTNMPQEISQYRKISELDKNSVYIVLGMYVVPANKSKYGEHANMCLVDDNGEVFVVNLPHHLLEVVQTIINEDKLVEGVNNGDCKVKVKDYFTKKYNKNCTTLEFC